MPEQEQEVMQKVLDRLTRIETKLDSYNDAKNKTYENEKEIIRLKADVAALVKENSIQNNEIADLKEKNKWMFRTAAGAVIAGLINILITLVTKGVGM